MPDEYDWQCSDCGTLIEGPDTRKCPNCGGIEFYPLADEARGTVETDFDVDRALDELSAREG